MQTPSLNEINAFVAVAEHCSFSKAAEQLGMSPSNLSGIIRSLEDRFGCRLLNRTTRSVAPTAIGEVLLRDMRPILNDYLAAVRSIEGMRDRPGGLLRLAMQPGPANFIIAPLLKSFLEKYPDISVDISSGVSHDIVAGHFDAGVGVSEQIDRDMIAVRISNSLKMAVCASPNYFKRHPPPRTLEDLAQHNCLRHRRADGVIYPWVFQKKGKNIEVKVSGSLTAADAGVMIRAAVDGLGLLYASPHYVDGLIEQGALVQVLQGWCRQFDGFYLYYPSRRHIPQHLQAFVDFCKTSRKT